MTIISTTNKTIQQGWNLPTNIKSYGLSFKTTLELLSLDHRGQSQFKNETKSIYLKKTPGEVSLYMYKYW